MGTRKEFEEFMDDGVKWQRFYHTTDGSLDYVALGDEILKEYDLQPIPLGLLGQTFGCMEHIIGIIQGAYKNPFKSS